MRSGPALVLLEQRDAFLLITSRNPINAQSPRAVTPLSFHLHHLLQGRTGWGSGLQPCSHRSARPWRALRSLRGRWPGEPGASGCLGRGRNPFPQLPPLLAHQVLLSPRSLCGAEASIPQTLCPELMGGGYFLSGILGLGPPLSAGELQSGVGTCLPPQAEVARLRVHRGWGQEREVAPRPTTPVTTERSPR